MKVHLLLFYVLYDYDVIQSILSFHLRVTAYFHRNYSCHVSSFIRLGAEYTIVGVDNTIKSFDHFSLHIIIIKCVRKTIRNHKTMQYIVVFIIWNRGKCT